MPMCGAYPNPAKPRGPIESLPASCTRVRSRCSLIAARCGLRIKFKLHPASIQAAVQAFTANDPLRQPGYAGFVCAYQTPPIPAQPFYELLSGTTRTGSSVVVTNAVV